VAGKVTVGLALHWPCVTDSSGLSTYGLNSQRMGDEHPAYTPNGAWPGMPLTTCEQVNHLNTQPSTQVNSAFHPPGYLN